MYHLRSIFLPCLIARVWMVQMPDRTTYFFCSLESKPCFSTSSELLISNKLTTGHQIVYRVERPVQIGQNGVERYIIQFALTD